MSNHAFPRGESAVAMCVCAGRIVVATTARVYVLNNDGVLEPLQIVAEPGAGESQVFVGPAEGA